MAYFDGPGGTQVPRTVVAAVTDYLVHHNANAHWAFRRARKRTGSSARSREALGDFRMAAPAEVAFGRQHDDAHVSPGSSHGRRLGPGGGGAPKGGGGDRP